MIWSDCLVSQMSRRRAKRTIIQKRNVISMSRPENTVSVSNPQSKILPLDSNPKTNREGVPQSLSAPGSSPEEQAGFQLPSVKLGETEKRVEPTGMPLFFGLPYDFT